MSITVNLDVASTASRMPSLSLDSLLIGRDDEVALLTDCVREVARARAGPC